MLALQLGRLPSELGHQMTAAEETAFMAYFREEPFGDHRSDIMLAQIAQILWNANTSKRDSAKKLTDFLPFYKKRATVDDDVSDKIKERFSMLTGKNDGG